jgi:hypothetical protein
MSIFIKPWWIKNVWQRIVPVDVRFAVTFQSRDLSRDDVATFTDYSLSHAKLRVADEAETGEAGAIVNGYFTTSWLIWQSDLDSVSAPDPKVGDQIVQDGGATWRITRIRNTLMREVWDCAVQQVT